MKHHGAFAGTSQAKHPISFFHRQQVYRCWFSNGIPSVHVSVLQFSNLQYFKLFHYIIFVMIICDQWPLMLPLQFVLRCHEPHQYRTANNSANACLLIAPIPFFLPLLESPQFLRHRDIESKSVSNPILTSKGPSERNSHRSLTLSHKLKWSNSVREAWRKSRLAKNYVSCTKHSGCGCKRNVLEWNLKCYSSEHMNNKKGK